MLVFARFFFVGLTHKIFHTCYFFAVTLRGKEVETVRKELSGTSATPRKKDTFLVQWMNVKQSFYYDIGFFDTIDVKTWIAKATNLIKKVEREAANNDERRKFFVYEKVHVKFQ